MLEQQQLHYYYYCYCYCYNDCYHYYYYSCCLNVVDVCGCDGSTRRRS